MKRARMVEPDIIRSWAMLYIIGYWHLSDYYPAMVAVRPEFATPLFRGFLCAFFFISGLLLASPGQGYGFTAWRRFLGKRFLRIYPPYAVALTLMFLFSMSAVPTWAVYGSSLTLLAAFLDLSPATLWFINVIFIYYFMFSISFYIRNSIYFFGLIGASLVLLYGLHTRIALVDDRLIFYAPAFFVGVAAGWHPWLLNLLTNRLVGFICMICLWPVGMATVHYGHGGMYILASLAFSLMFLPAAWVVTRLLMGVPGMARGSALVAYLSFMAYMVHRFVYIVLIECLGAPEHLGASLLQAYGVLLPTTLILGYILQWQYDRYCAMLTASGHKNG